MDPMNWVVGPDWSWQQLLLPQMDAGTTALDFKMPKGGGQNGPAPACDSAWENRIRNRKWS